MFRSYPCQSYITDWLIMSHELWRNRVEEVVVATAAAAVMSAAALC